jgi:hypothetical protein
VRLYDHKEYEDAMFHFNTTTRTTYHEHSVVAPGIDHCFDCMSEVFILDLFLKEQRGIDDAAHRLQQVAELSKELTQAISTTGRTLCID